MEDMTDNFMLRRRHKGDGRWTWRMRREDRQVPGPEDYVLAQADTYFSTQGLGRQGFTQTTGWY